MKEQSRDDRKINCCDDYRIVAVWRIPAFWGADLAVRGSGWVIRRASIAVLIADHSRDKR